MNRKKIVGWIVGLSLMGFVGGQAFGQDTVRVMCYNLLRYGAAGIGCTPTGVTARNTWISGIIGLARPDIFGVNEMGPSSGPTSPSNNLLVNILQPINPAYRATTITYNGFQDVTNMMYYNSDKFGLAQEAVIPEPTLDLRDINYYKFYYKGPNLPLGDTTFLEVVQVHLHASDAASRTAQTAAIMHFLDSLGRPGNFIVQGDFNLDGSTPQSFQNMVAHPNPDCKMNDLLNLTGNWHGNANVRFAMTQATDPNPNNPCGSGGALDDRFDHILVSNDIENDADGVSYVPGSYWVLGNPHAPNPSVGSTVQSYIKLMSDHHPLTIDLAISQAITNGTSDPLVDRMRIHPNPASGRIHVRFSSTAWMNLESKLELVSLSGQTIHVWPVTSVAAGQDLSLDASGIAAGAYFLRFIAGDQLLDTQKVLIGLRD